ncbi:MAG: efflux RND transporter periplasmic adaptor subunit [Polyangiaceae bacterium]
MTTPHSSDRAMFEPLASRRMRPDRPISSNNGRVLTWTASLFLVLSLIACNRSNAEAGKAKRPPPLVVAATAITQDVPVEVEAPVDLRPLEQVDVGSKVLGYLDAVLIDRGDRVRRGQPIALVRPSDLPDQLAAARSSVAQVQASALLAKTNFDRATKLHPAGVVSEQELEQSKTALVASEAAESAAKAQLEALAVRLGETRIVAPIDGLVASRKLDPGALVGPTAPGSIATIMRVDRLRAYITVVERFATSVVVGMPARVQLDAAPNEPFQGTVVRVAPAVDPNTRTLEAEVQIDNRDGRLRPGMYGRGFIQIGKHQQATLVPVNAVQFTSKGEQVFIVNGNRAQLRSVHVGVEADGGAMLEIVDGLTPGERVVVAGADGLGDGSEVRVHTGKPGTTETSTANQPVQGAPSTPHASGAPKHAAPETAASERPSSPTSSASALSPRP